MAPPDIGIDPYASDVDRLGVSLANLAELMLGCLDAAQARSVAEVGAYAGDLTGLLLAWAARSGARVLAIDPSPQDELEGLARERSELELLRETSLDALARIDLPDAVIIDGDHNYYTVTHELALLGERTDGPELPLLLFHDVAWPHARRDDYFDPELVPAGWRQPTAHNASIFPGVAGTRDGGIPYHWPAAREGGPRNGVLTAVEDFVESDGGLALAVVPAFFGFGAVWHRDAPYADAVEELLAPWLDNAVVARMEANRVFHLASAHGMKVQRALQSERDAAVEEVLRRLLSSSAFALAERLSRLRDRVGIARGETVVSKDELRRALAD